MKVSQGINKAVVWMFCKPKACISVKHYLNFLSRIANNILWPLSLVQKFEQDPQRFLPDLSYLNFFWKNHILFSPDS